jgi:acetamidase/formamidase
VVDAEPGDSLLVFTLSITPTEKKGFSWFKSDFGALVSSTTTPMLNPPLIEKVWSYEIENNNVKIRFNDDGREVTLEYKPFLGSIGCAPLEEAPHSLVPNRHGGNMDAIENGIGSCLILPVLVPGAYLYFGDAHAVQGDGELCGTAVEIPTNVVLRIDLVKGKQVSWPMIENNKFIMAVGSARPLEDAYRIACKEIVLWLHKEKGFELRDAYQLASQTIKCRIGNVVDPFYSIVAKFPKAIL